MPELELRLEPAPTLHRDHSWRKGKGKRKKWEFSHAGPLTLSSVEFFTFYFYLFPFAFFQMLSCRTEANSPPIFEQVAVSDRQNCRMSQRTYNQRALFLLLVLATVSLTRAFAIGLAQEKLPPPTGHINDFAAVIGNANKDRLESILEQLNTRTNVDLVIALVKTAGSQELYDYSLHLANEWNIGSRTSTRKTLLLVVATDNGRFFTQFSRPAQSALPDGLVGEMGRKMRPKLEANDF